MYAIIRAGGKQHKVAEGDVIEIERLKDEPDEISFVPLLIVGEDGATTSDAAALKKALVTAKVLGEGKGAKVDVYKYRSKTGYRRHSGHRQRHTSIQISGIKL